MARKIVFCTSRYNELVVDALTRATCASLVEHTIFPSLGLDRGLQSIVLIQDMARFPTGHKKAMGRGVARSNQSTGYWDTI